MTTTTDLLRRAAGFLREWDVQTGGCDHDVGICNCDWRQTANALLALAEQMERAEPGALTAFQKSAPERVWINVFGTEDDYPDGFPANHEDITWAEDEVGDLDIPYVRADLAHPAPDDVRDAERYRKVRRGQRWSVINGIGDVLRGEALDAAVDAMQEPKP